MRLPTKAYSHSIQVTPSHPAPAAAPRPAMFVPSLPSACVLFATRALHRQHRVAAAASGFETLALLPVVAPFLEKWRLVTMSIVYFNEILNAVGKSAKLKNTISGVAKQTGCAAAGTAAGGLIMGPIGALFGGVMGAIYGYQNSGDYDNIVTCLSSMSDDEKRQVVARVQRLVGSVSIEELVRYLSTEAHREILIGVLSDFVSQKMSS